MKTIIFCSKKYLSKLVITMMFSLCFISTAGLAHDETQAPHQTFHIDNFELKSGEFIEDFSLSYVTHGTINRNKSNVILMASALGGNHHRIDFMIGPGLGLDTNKYFIICTDAIGNGLTTSPSTSETQHGMDFPQFTLEDMVKSQYLMLQSMDINHLVAVAGASMGGMQGIQWAVSYPDFADNIISLTGAARISAWSYAFLDTTNRVLMLDPAWNGGQYTEQPEQGWRLWTDLLLALLAAHPDGINQQYPSGPDGKGLLDWWEDVWLSKNFDANDMIYQSNAVNRYNVGNTHDFAGDHIEALKSIKARVLFMPATNDILVPLTQAIED
jgi:homoserine O-acetyltransferase